MKAYIVDIDGTLANIEHRLHFIKQKPKDWDGFFAACGDDKPIQDVIGVIRCLAQSARIIYLTGRPERVRHETLVWFGQHGVPSGRLIMREDSDHRPDTIAKKELMEKLGEGGYQIVGVFEDRPSVCRVWREMGLTVFQMTDKEF